MPLASHPKMRGETLQNIPILGPPPLYVHCTAPSRGLLMDKPLTAQPQMAENQSQTRHILWAGGLSGLVILLAEQYQPLTPLGS